MTEIGKRVRELSKRDMIDMIWDMAEDVGLVENKTIHTVLAEYLHQLELRRESEV